MNFTITTRKQILPYEFTRLPNGKVCILKTNGQKLIVTQAEVTKVLESADLDVHRRRMYEAALQEFEQ